MALSTLNWSCRGLVVSHLMWVLETESESSQRAVATLSNLDCGAMSLDPEDFFKVQFPFYFILFPPESTEDFSFHSAKLGSGLLCECV